MKKIILITAILMTASLMACAFAEDAFPQPEGGKKFDTWWAVPDCTVYIAYEEEGYRVLIERIDTASYTGAVWSYNCLYSEEEDALISLTSEKTAYSVNPEDVDLVLFDPPAYEGPDAEGTETLFRINENGRLVWTDGHENAGEGMEFYCIGRFAGSWKNDASDVWAEFSWSGYDGSFWYNVYLERGSIDDTRTIFHMKGVYNPETGRLECAGPATVYTRNAEGLITETEDGETYEAFFSVTEDGRILYEADGGIVLEEDFDING